MKVNQGQTQNNPHETEAAFVIRSDNSERVAGEIAGLKALGEYRLEPQKAQTIHDHYFDTPERALQRQQLALRIRLVNGKHLITLKGRSRRLDLGVSERIEIELSWSRKALTLVLQELSARNIRIEKPRVSFSRASPVQTMKQLGLEIVQDRKTRRQVRNILSQDKSNKTVIAELAIDSVTFRFGGKFIRLHEIEIESKTKNYSVGFAAVVKSLKLRYRPVLKPWESKLATGYVIGELLEKDEIRKFLAKDKSLKPAAYDVIGRYLRHESRRSRLE